MRRLHHSGADPSLQAPCSNARGAIEVWWRAATGLLDGTAWGAPEGRLLLLCHPLSLHHGEAAWHRAEDFTLPIRARHPAGSHISAVGASALFSFTHAYLSRIFSYSPFQKECPIWGPAVGDQQLCRAVTCSTGVRPKGCRETALVSFGRAAWPEAMQSAHVRALLPALPWQLM